MLPLRVNRSGRYFPTAVDSTAKSAFAISLSFTYDALGRKLTEVGPQGTATSEWDLAGRRTKLTYPGSGLYVNYDYLVTGEVTKVRENGVTSGVGVLATYDYDPATTAGQLGLPTKLTFGNGAIQAFTYDPVSRLASLSNDLSGTSNDLSVTLAYNPASQIASTVRTGDAYAWTGHGLGSTAYVSNGLNQQVTIGGSSAGWADQRGNLTTDPTSGKTYSYWPSTNQLWTVGSPWTTLSYDPLDRLAIVDSSTDTKFAYDGLDTLAEYNGSDVLQRRFVFGPGIDEPLVQYEGSGTSNRTFLSADDLGSIISLTDSSGTLININRYDEYGKPQGTNTGRFQYTGQKWIGEAGLYDYKARSYLPHLGIFAQTDPIGYAGGINLYAYVGNDPINATDPLGLQQEVWVRAGWSCATQPVVCMDASGPGSPSRWNSGSSTSEGSNQLVVVRCGQACQRKRRPPLIRRLNNYELGILSCSGVDSETLNNITLVGFLPTGPLTPNTYGGTVPDGNGIAIFLRGGTWSGYRDLGQMLHIAHEVSHAMGYSRGTSVADILFGYVYPGYEQSSEELTARAFADRVEHNIRTGRC